MGCPADEHVLGNRFSVGFSGRLGMVMDGVLGVCAGQRWVIRGPQGSTLSGESKALRADIDDALGQ